MAAKRNGKVKLSLQLKFIMGIFLIIFPMLAAIFIWNGLRTENQSKKQILMQARIFPVK
jgi:hypothetical protein